MVFVTGGTGLVGSHLICHLLRQGNEVRALARSASNKKWFEQTARWLLDSEYERLIQNLSWSAGDLSDILTLSDHIEGCSQVYHAAAVVSFSAKDKEALFQTNVVGTQNLFNACLSKSNQPDVCFVSSTATIGTVEKIVADERIPFSKETSRSYYSYTKYLAELEAFRAREEGLNVAIINPSVVLGYGNWDRGSSGFFRNGKKGFRFYTPGSNAFVDARDVARAAHLLMEEKVFHDKFLCTAWNKSFYDVFKTIAEGFDARKPDIKVRRRLAEMAWRLAAVASLVTGRSLITKESARSGLREMSYTSQKLIDQLGFEFMDFDESVTSICEAYGKG